MAYRYPCRRCRRRRPDHRYRENSSTTKKNNLDFSAGREPSEHISSGLALSVRELSDILVSFQLRFKQEQNKAKKYNETESGPEAE